MWASEYGANCQMHLRELMYLAFVEASNMKCVLSRIWFSVVACGSVALCQSTKRCNRTKSLKKKEIIDDDDDVVVKW